MTAQALAEAEGQSLPGRTTLTGRALQQLAVGLVRDAAGVAAREVSVTLADELGSVKVTATIPLLIGGAATQSVTARGTTIREAVIHGMQTLAGRMVSSVDIRFSGVREIQERRVL